MQIGVDVARHAADEDVVSRVLGTARRPHAMKRMIDVAVAAILLIFLLPAMLPIALLVAMDGGPVLFRHRRVGKDGVPFDCLKFRTMFLGAEECLPEYFAYNPAAAAEWRRDQKLSADPRITGIGKMLRRSSLDELPQFLNVLRGEMSLVGPRPVTYQEFDERYGSFGRYYTSVLPGITGLWQTAGRNTLSYEERVQLDVQYVTSWSLLLDCRLLAKTLVSATRQTGAG